MSTTIISKLSSLNYSYGDLCLTDLELTQFARAYAGGFKFNFIDALSGAQNFKKKTNTNLYLTKPIKLNEVLDENTYRVKSSKISTALNFSKLVTNYLKFKPTETVFIDGDSVGADNRYYGLTEFTTNSNLDQTTRFDIEFIDEVFCTVSCIINNVVYYLVVSDDEEINGIRNVYFVAKNKLSSTGTYLEYSIYESIDKQYISLLSTKDNKKFFLNKEGNKLVATKITTESYIDLFYIFSKSASIDNNAIVQGVSPYNTSFVEYDSEFNINNNKSNFDLRSNYLLSKVNNGENTFNILCLKNISDNFDSFTSSNNLLSGLSIEVFAEKLREYTSIFEDIPTEKDENLILNYVTYNQHYNIKPGVNFFQAPSSLNPFEKLNINDSKISECGAFAYTYPYFSDRIYKLEDTSTINGSQYLCTWLSGAPGKEGIWVDRYYYPDVISKESALQAQPAAFIPTYSDPVELLIQANSNLKTSLEDKKFFDKRSDLTFESSKKYKYERIKIESTGPSINYCDLVQLNSHTNYYNTINSSGGFALFFNYTQSDFNIVSDRNDIDGGISIVKQGQEIYFRLSLYDSSITNSIVLENFEYIYKDKTNSGGNIYVSVNTIVGKISLYINGVLVYEDDIGAYKYTNKSVLFGDIKINGIDILKYSATDNKLINDIKLYTSPVDKEQDLNNAIINQVKNVGRLIISLPCGMVNQFDRIKLINVLDSNLKSKSNYVDVNIKNLNITDSKILDSIRHNLLSTLEVELPATIKVKNINFINYK